MPARTTQGGGQSSPRAIARAAAVAASPGEGPPGGSSGSRLPSTEFTVKPPGAAAAAAATARSAAARGAQRVTVLASGSPTAQSGPPAAAAADVAPGAPGETPGAQQSRPRPKRACVVADAAAADEEASRESTWTRFQAQPLAAAWSAAASLLPPAAETAAAVGASRTQTDALTTLAGVTGESAPTVGRGQAGAAAGTRCSTATHEYADDVTPPMRAAGALHATRIAAGVTPAGVELVEGYAGTGRVPFAAAVAAASVAAWARIDAATVTAVTFHARRGKFAGAPEKPGGGRRRLRGPVPFEGDARVAGTRENTGSHDAESAALPGRARTVTACGAAYAVVPSATDTSTPPATGRRRARGGGCRRRRDSKK